MKILCIHASAGAGHFKAAEALYNNLKNDRQHQVFLVDSLDLTSPMSKNLYRSTYTFLVSKIPWAWGAIFGLLDWPILQPLVRAGRRIYNSINAAKLHKYLEKEQFDVIFSTHFMGTEVAGALKSQRKIRSRVICIVTDYDVHRIWLAGGVDQYCVASDWTKKKLLKLGVHEGKIFVTGIPTDEHFSRVYDLNELRGKFGLASDRFTVLMATGSFGFGPMEKIIEQLKDFQVIVVCGHNKDLFQRLLKKNYAHAKVFGMVHNMYELMAVSQAMVTKPGGLSISEALVRNLPMVFFNAIPGQETNNINVLAEHGIGINGSIPKIGEIVKVWVDSPEKYQQAVKATQKLARPGAVKDIINLLSL